MLGVWVLLDVHCCLMRQRRSSFPETGRDHASYSGFQPLTTSTPAHSHSAFHCPATPRHTPPHPSHPPTPPCLVFHFVHKHTCAFGNAKRWPSNPAVGPDSCFHFYLHNRLLNCQSKCIPTFTTRKKCEASWKENRRANEDQHVQTHISLHSATSRKYKLTCVDEAWIMNRGARHLPHLSSFYHPVLMFGNVSYECVCVCV